METRKKRVLVVDDNAELRKSLGICFRAEGFDVLYAEDGNEGLERVREDGTDMVILDLRMPGMDGWTMLRALRDDPRTEALPVVLLTATKDEQSKVLGFRSGADDYLQKPFHALELIARVERLFERQKLMAASDQAEHPMDKVPVRTGEKVTFIPLEEICFIEAAGKYSYVHPHTGKYFADYSLKELEDAIRAPDEFMRIHRCFIVNRSKIAKVNKEAPSRYVVELDNEGRTQLCVSQRKLKTFKGIMHLH